MATTKASPTKRRPSKAVSEAVQDTSVIEAWNAYDDFAAEPAIEADVVAPKRSRKKKSDEPVAEAAPAVEAAPAIIRMKRGSESLE